MESTRSTVLLLGFLLTITTFKNSTDARYIQVPDGNGFNQEAEDTSIKQPAKRPFCNRYGGCSASRRLGSKRWGSYEVNKRPYGGYAGYRSTPDQLAQFLGIFDDPNGYFQRAFKR